MGGAPLEFELLHLGVANTVRLEFSPSIQTALVPEGQIADFADFALRRVGGEGPVWDAEDLAGRDAIRLISRILSRIDAAVGIELPLLVADPGEDPGFNAGEIGANQLMPRCGADHAARDIADHCERLGIQAANVRIVTCGNRCDGSAQILGFWPLQVLGLYPIASPATGAGTVVAQGAANAAIAVTAVE